MKTCPFGKRKNGAFMECWRGTCQLYDGVSGQCAFMVIAIALKGIEVRTV